MDRTIYDDLLRWKRNADRKPLLLEGIKLAGKAHILTYFGQQKYDNVVYFNFKDDPGLADIFTEGADPVTIVRDLGLRSSERIEPVRTLIILDEIQFCNPALMSMRLFCEKAPEYHIACAGSMGMMLPAGSFPVGNVERIRIGPKDYRKFLSAYLEEPPE